MKRLWAMCLGACVGLAAGGAMALDDVTDCTSTQKTDIVEVAKFLSDHWTEFKATLESATGLDIDTCIYNRFNKNGDVKCKDTDGVCDCAERKSKGKSCVMGWANPLDKKVRLCAEFLQKIEGMEVQNRRACYAALLTHEYGHSCDRFESGSEKVEKAAFDYWKAKHSAVTIQKSDCGMD